MRVRQKDGFPLRVHLEQAAYGVIPDADALMRLASAPFLPSLCADLWAYYNELHRRRVYNENGPVRFAWVDIQAFLSVTKLRLAIWEVFTLLTLEDVFFQVQAETKV